MENLHVLDGKAVDNTSSKRIKIVTEFETSFSDPEFKVLGFIGDDMFIYTSNYISKYTSAGSILSRYYIEVSHGTFNDNVPYFYAFKENILYKFSKNLDLVWYKELEAEIGSINMDSAGSVIVLFKYSRIILKLDTNGDRVLYLYYSHESINQCRLHRSFISSGRTWLYVIGSLFKGTTKTDFICKYNTITGQEVWNRVYDVGTGKIDTEESEVKRFHVSEERIYIEGYNFIKCVNPMMLTLWESYLGYNSKSESINKLAYIEYDNTSFDEFIYFCENLFDTKGFSIGKLDVNGNLLWKYTCPEQKMDPMFAIAVDDGYMYTWGIESIDMFDERILSLDNNQFVFYTNENRLVRIVEYNKEIYNSSFYQGFPLLADDTTKENPEFIYKPLLYKEKDKMGIVTTEDGEDILLTEENEFRLDDEEYTFMRLIGDLEDTTQYEETYIVTDMGIPIFTSDDEHIVTSKVYGVDLTYDSITDIIGKAITDMEGEEITVADGRPFIYFGLLADYFKMYAKLVTKRLRRNIVTKKERRNIVKLAPIIYKYNFRKLKDINLLVEFLVQNNVLETAYPRYIEQLRKHTFNVLQTANNNVAPCYFNIKTTKMDHFTFDAVEFPVDRNYESIFLVKNMPFNKKEDYRPLDIRCMVDMVKDETVTPFLLFVNGRCIKWTDMTIVRDWHDTYIIIDNMTDDTVYSDQVDCILFPCTIRYGEDNEIEELSPKGLYFSEEGIFTTNPDKIGIRMEVIDDEVICENNTTNPSNNIFDFDANVHKLATERNIFVFEQGLFFGDNRYYIDDSGYNVFKYTHPVDATFRTFLYINGLESKDIVFNVPNKAELREELTDMLTTGNIYKNFFSNNKFSITFSRKETYDRNIAKAIAFIINYDPRILSSMEKYHEYTKVYHSEDHEHLLDKLADDPGYAFHVSEFMSRGDRFGIPFVNGKLVEGNYAFNRQHFEFIANNVAESDKAELVTFNTCDNTMYDFVCKMGEPYYLSKELRETGFYILAIPVGASGRYRELEVGFEHVYDENGKYAGTIFNKGFEEAGRYKIVSARQCRYAHTVHQLGLNFRLPTEMAMCTRDNHLLVFADGVLTDKWTLDDMVFTSSGTTGSRISLLYTPNPYELLTYDTYVCDRGTRTIVLPENFCDIPFDTENYWVFRNGLKVSSEDIECISANSFAIKTLPGIATNLQIVKFDVADSIARELYSLEDNNEIWRNYVGGLDPAVYKSLFE